MRRIRRFIFRSACSVRMGNHLTLASTGPSSLYLKTLDSSARCRSYDNSFKKAEAGETRWFPQFFSDALSCHVLTGIDHPHWVGDEISQILELDRMFDRNDCPEHRHRDDRGFDILQFTIHILDTQPVDRIRYRNRNCTRLKYHFHVINIGKEMARLIDGRGGTTAVSGMSALPFMHFGSARLTGISVRKQMDTRSTPTEPSNIEREFEPGRTPTAMPAAYAVPEQTTRLSGETLVDNRRSWRSDDAVVGGNANHKKWVRQKITEGGV
ncbi:hypothetical protein CBS147337_10326 [Penicillium roqueforti]|nr:hypothetical protein CBS147337_10326 [Penicillium roqueforti]